MKVQNSTWIMFLFVLGMICFSLFFYPRLPDPLASHWNARGQVDGCMSKTAGLLMIPGISLGLLILMLGMAQIDPLKRNIQKIRGVYNAAIFLILGFMFVVQAHIISWNLGFQVRINVLLPVMLAVLFFGLGSLMDKLRPNWVIGIRTPWTLSSKQVWMQTHHWAGLLFKAAACIVLLGAVWSDYAIFFVMAPVLSVSALLMILSYIFYRREQKQNALKSDI